MADIRPQDVSAEINQQNLKTILHYDPETGAFTWASRHSNKAAASRKPAASRSKLPAKYKGPNGELWAGGPGRKPEWVKAVLAAGQGLDQYLIA